MINKLRSKIQKHKSKSNASKERSAREARSGVPTGIIVGGGGGGGTLLRAASNSTLPRDLSHYSSVDDMYSDSGSSTTGSEYSEDSFPGYISVPMADDEMIGATYASKHGPGTRMYQAYKGQLKLSAYINYGLLTVHVMTARHLRSKVKTPCDSHVKLSLVPDDMRRTSCKTEVIHDTNSPLYDEKFSFEMMDEDGPKRLFISVWNRDPTRKDCEFLGCMSFGINHIRSNRKTINGWYYLLNGDIGRSKHLQVTDRKHLLEKTAKLIPKVNQDVMWMEPCSMVVRRGKSGFGFTINGSCPVTVCRVDAGSSAEVAGVKVGDCIVRIDGLNVSRSSCESVARCIKHAHKHIILEVQRPKQQVDSDFPLENLDRSPARKPLHSTTPFGENTAGHHYDDVTPWKHAAGTRRHLDTVVEEDGAPTSPPKRRNYGWIDAGDDGGDRYHGYSDEEDIYVEPDEIRPEVLRIPQDPPALPPNHPAMRRGNSAGSRLDEMVISPWKPPPGTGNHHHRPQQRQPPQQTYRDEPYMPLGAPRQYHETDLDEGSESHYGSSEGRYSGSEGRYEWDYTDTRLDNTPDDGPTDNYGWIDSHWPPGKPSATTGSSSGYSSATLPRSLKLGGKQRTSKSSISSSGSSGYHGYSDDMAIRSTGAGAHGYQGDRKQHYREDYYGNQRGYHGDEGMTRHNTGSSSHMSGHHSTGSLPRKKKVSFRDFS